MRCFIPVHTGLYQDELFQVKHILVHESTSLVDQVCSWLLQHPAGSGESCRIAAAERRTCSNRNHFINSFARWPPRWLLLCRRCRLDGRRWRRSLGRGWRSWRIPRRGDQLAPLVHWIHIRMQCKSALYLEHSLVIDMCCNGSVVVEDALWWCWRRNEDRINVVPGVLGSKDQPLLKHDQVKWKQLTCV